jgi:pyruvate,water dikinase
MIDSLIPQMGRWRCFPLPHKDKIFTYDQAYKLGIKKIGTKAFNTACWSIAGNTVPNSVVISVQAFSAYIRKENQESIFNTIESYFDIGKMLIIRSSALSEDSNEASYAGQYLSIICENRAAEIKTACEACWSSSFSSNVQNYHNIIKQTSFESNTAMGLLIQELINASSSGVCFTKDPLKNNEAIFIINSVYGLGETLMAEEVVADHYEYDIKRNKIVRSIVGRQTQWRSPEFPHILSPIPEKLQKKATLSITQLAEIARMAQRASKLFKNHLDIEWAYEGDKLFLLQARPITSVAQKRKYELWTRDNVADVIPDAVTPLTWSMVNEATNKGFKRAIRELGIAIESTTLFKVFDGRVYFNQTSYQKMLNSGIKKNPVLLMKVGYKYLRSLITLRKAFDRLTNSFWEGLNSFCQSAEKSSMTALKAYFEKYMVIHIRIAILMEFGFLVIRTLIRKYVPEDQVNPVIDGLVTGLNKIESTASGEALCKLASLIKDNSKLTDKILSSTDQKIPDVLKAWGGIYLNEWQQFMEHYGYSSLKEFEIYYPRWIEDPRFVGATLKHYLSENEGIHLEKTKISCSKKRIEAERTLLKTTPSLYHLPLKFYITHIRQCSAWRESNKQKLVRLMAEIRKKAMEFAEKYEIEPSKMVFFLTSEEISEFKDGSITAEILEELKKRKKDWEKWQKQKPYKEIRILESGCQIKIPYLSGVGSHLNGMPLSSGKFTGVARVIIDPTQMEGFNLGDILVTHSTNPSWMPLFTLAGAIVTDMGNYLSHGAIVAREMGIPAVGNLYYATKVIENGQIISVDGKKGIVHLEGKIHEKS